MASEIYNAFVKESNNVPFDPEHRRKLNFNISRYDQAVLRGKRQFSQLETAKQRAANLKHKTIENLDKYLIEFESNFIKKGGKVIWAQTAGDAVSEILKIMHRHEAKLVVKSKSMTTEEIDINQALAQHGIESIETDLGEYIVQLAGEKPYHIVTPAIHKSKEDVAKLFNEKFGMPIESTPVEITGFVRKMLREKFITADVGITGANFLIADTGSVCLTENEGNAMMTFSFPKVHIAIAGIEKLIPSIRDLDLLWPLLATHGTGQNITAYNSVISGPRQIGETDGPAEMYVIILDNGRSEILRHREQRSALWCIRCGACLNACPVYKNIGGYTYNATYTGPIGSVITPHLRGMQDYKHLSFASTLCGKCTEVCPVKINLHELLQLNRKESVARGYISKDEKFIQLGVNRFLSSRKMMNFGKISFKNMLLNTFVKKMWGPRRVLPKLAPKNFNQLWEEQRGEKSLGK